MLDLKQLKYSSNCAFSKIVAIIRGVNYIHPRNDQHRFANWQICFFCIFKWDYAFKENFSYCIYCSLYNINIFCTSYHHLYYVCRKRRKDCLHTFEDQSQSYSWNCKPKIEMSIVVVLFKKGERIRKNNFK